MEAVPAHVCLGGWVRTPTGALAEVMAVYAGEGEALVQWTTGDRARFTFAHLREPPTKA